MNTYERIAYWTKKLHLEAHPEGGWFSEVYACPAGYGLSQDGRVMGGSIYFLLGTNDISHFHVIDCEEIWYIHEGCGIELWLLSEAGPAEGAADFRVERRLLGCGEGMEPMIAIPKGVIFSARNIDPEGYSLMSCATMPNFHYEGFRMTPQAELFAKFPGHEQLIREMAFETC